MNNRTDEKSKGFVKHLAWRFQCALCACKLFRVFPFTPAGTRGRLLNGLPQQVFLNCPEEMRNRNFEKQMFPGKRIESGGGRSFSLECRVSGEANPGTSRAWAQG
jgi:hypothetical protein